MGFRIRSDSDDDNIYEASMSAYRKHLNKLGQDNAIAADLKKYFYWDFFHDGWIQEIVFLNGTAEVQMKIVCQNIKRKTKNQDFEYINVPFLCTFIEVAYFKFERTVDEKNEYHYDPGQFTFLGSEIDTLSELPKFQPKEDSSGRNNSLIIEVLPDNASCSSFIEIVFRCVTVEAVESVAFELMLASTEFEVPIYKGEEIP